MEIERISHRRLIPYLERTGAAGVFARYVAAAHPDGSSLAAVDSGTIAAVALSGRPWRMFEVYGYWLFADTAGAAVLLAESLAASDSGSAADISFALEYIDHLRPVFSGRPVTIDHLYLLDAAPDPAPRDAGPVIKLQTETLHALRIHPDFLPMLGSFEDWNEATELHGIVRDGRLLCIGDIHVQDGTNGAIQQVYTLPGSRGKGLAEVLVHSLARRLFQLGKRPVYHVAESNTASIRVAVKNGFRLDSRWGCVEG